MTPRFRRRAGVTLVAAGVTLGVAATQLWEVLRRAPAPPQAVRAVSLQVPPAHRLLDLAVSADGARVAYTAIVERRRQLFVRGLDRFDATAVPGTDGAEQPFFSPDGSTLGFFADGYLQTAPVAADAEPVRICRVPGRPAGAVWRPDDVIVFAGPGATGLQTVPATGGTPTPLTTIDADAGETAHGWPSVVDARFMLFTVGRHGYDPRLTLLDLETGATRPLLPADGRSFGVAPDLLVYARREELFAARLDRTSPQGAPSPRPLMEGVATHAVGYHGLGRSRFAAAADGTLVFAPAPARTGNRLVWVDRTGQTEPVDDVIDTHGTPRLSPDGAAVVFTTATGILRRDLWLLDLSTGQRRPLTAEAGDNHSPLWSVDGTRLTFASSRGGLQQLYEMRLPPRETRGPVVDGDLRTPGGWTPDGRRLAFHEVHPARGRDLWLWSDDTGARAWLATAANERAPRFSPDGRWIAYVSDGGGDGDQVYLQPADGSPADRPPLRVSPIGGTEPVWGKAADGPLYFRRGRTLYEVAISGGTPVGPPVPLFDGPFLSDVLDNVPAYDVSSDGERFLMLEPAASPGVIHLYGGWPPVVFPPPE